jgi:hypothetical protein
MSNYQGWSVLVVENASGPSIESTKKNLDGFIISYGPINMCMAGWGGITCNPNFISHRLAKCSTLRVLGWDPHHLVFQFVVGWLWEEAKPYMYRWIPHESIEVSWFKFVLPYLSNLNPRFLFGGFLSFIWILYLLFWLSLRDDFWVFLWSLESVHIMDWSLAPMSQIPPSKIPLFVLIFKILKFFRWGCWYVHGWF